MFGLPFAVIFFIIAWLLLVYLFVPKGKSFTADRTVFKDEYSRLGPISYEEKAVLTLFVILSFPDPRWRLYRSRLVAVAADTVLCR